LTAQINYQYHKQRLIGISSGQTAETDRKRQAIVLSETFRQYESRYIQREKKNDNRRRNAVPEASVSHLLKSKCMSVVGYSKFTTKAIKQANKHEIANKLYNNQIQMALNL